MTNQPLTIILKVTNKCNLNCVYCYEEAKHTNASTVDELFLELLFDRIVEYGNKNARIIWHGGEPLSVNLNFFKKIVEIQGKFSDFNFRNSLQTNGTLLTKEYLEFFISNNFNIGISLDGIKKTHDENRPYQHNASSFDCVVNSINLLREMEYKINILCVLNKNTIGSIKDIYTFFKKEKINPRFNPQFQHGRARRGDLGITPSEYGSTMIEIFNMWFYDDHTDFFMEIAPLCNIIKNICGFWKTGKSIPRYADCTFSKGCANNFIAITPRGEVYPCGRFTNKSFCLGNIHEKNIYDAIHGEKNSIFFKRQHRGVFECKDCEHLELCNSGCPHNAYLDYNDILAKDKFCYGYKMLFSHIKNALKNELT